MSKATHLGLLPKPRLIEHINNARNEARYWHQQYLRACALTERVFTTEDTPDPFELAFARTAKDPDAIQHCRDLLEALELGERTRQRHEGRSNAGHFVKRAS